MHALLYVCDLVPKKFGAFERFLIGIARRCLRDQVRLGVILAGEPIAPVAAAFREHQIQWWVVDEMRSPSRLTRRISFLRAFLKIVGMGPWDVVAFNFFDEMNLIAACAFAKLFKGARFHAVWEQHSEIVPPSGFKSRLSWMRLSSPFISAFIGLSKAAARSMSQRSHRPDKVNCIYNGVSMPVSPRRGWLRKELSLPESATLITNVGGLIRLKAQDVLIEAIAPLLIEDKDRHLLIVGGGALKDELVTRAKLLAVEGQVHFLGIRNDVIDILAESELFVLPSRTEALPYSVIEAMSVGLPVIATTVGGLADLVADQQTGLLVAPDDVVQLRRALANLLENPSLARQYGEMGRRRADERFNLDQSIDQRFALYDRLMGMDNDRQPTLPFPVSSESTADIQ